jgi:DMSO/TMAO reductase YedYZ molybdopterin-dependent catalytic subunit
MSLRSPRHGGLPTALSDPFVTLGRESPSQQAPTSRVLLIVDGQVSRPLKLTAGRFARLPRKSVCARDTDGTEAEFDGVPVAEVLKAAGMKLGSDLRGPALANCLVVEAADGYRVVFALPELDPMYTDHVVLLADRRRGKPLGAKEGALRVIVPGDKHHSRWVRQVVALKIGRGLSVEPEPTAVELKTHVCM